MVPQEGTHSKNVTLDNGRARTEFTVKRGCRAFQGQVGAVAQRAAARSQSNVRQRARSVQVSYSGSRMVQQNDELVNGRDACRETQG
jgi:hypothetical protein